MAKAQVVSFYDISAWVILIIGMSIWLIIMRFENTGHEYKVEDKVLDLNQEEVFINILRSSRNNMTLLETMISSYRNGNMGSFQPDFNQALSDYYGGEVCWTLSIDNQTAAGSGCTKKDKMMDATIFVPSDKTMEVNLMIRGYK
jgi:hypothetical protein